MAQTDRTSGLVGNTAIKTPCDCATMAAITLSGEQVVDGFQTASSRVLVKNQTDATQNGIYVTDSGSWTRALDFDGTRDVVQGTLVTVALGSASINTCWRITTANPIVIGTSALLFENALINDSGNISFTQSGAGAVSRSVQDKLRERYTVKDTGATGIGSETAKIQAALTNSSVVVLNDLTTYTTGALVSTNNVIEWSAGAYTNNPNLADPLAASNLSDSPALTFTLDSRHAFSRRFGNVKENDIYNSIFPNINNFDVSSSVLHIVNGSTVENVTAVAGYFKNDNAANPSNPVALFGCGMVTANNGAGWGINTLLQDAATRTVGAGTGRILIGAELDFNVMNPGTQVLGVSVGGNSLSQPTSAAAFIANTLGTGIKWQGGFVTGDAACINGMTIGMVSAAGANVNSQTFLMSYTDAGSVKRNAVMDVEAGYWVMRSSGVINGLAIQGFSIFLDAGKNLTINGNQVVAGRQTGWQLPTGTLARTTFDQSTVTLPQLAQRVAALVTDLYSGHGLIGA